jgi:Transposase DDE domain group 1
VAAFDGGDDTSDAGGLLLGATARAIGLEGRLAACLADGRAQAQVAHTVEAMVAQRIYRCVFRHARHGAWSRRGPQGGSIAVP